MRKIAKLAVASLITASLGAASFSAMAGGDVVAEGKKLAVDVKKGNCLACHMMDDGPMPGTLGPPLIAMKARFPDKKALYDQIWDPSQKNSGTRMPLFGKHSILSDKDIHTIVEYLHTL